MDIQPDSTAVRTALWRALHVQIDRKPHVFEDVLGLQLVNPEKGWQQRPDMHPAFTQRLRAAMVARARFIEDLVEEQSLQGIDQYILLGAGIDTFAQRRADIASKLQIYEIDQPGTQFWKRRRLTELGIEIPSWLHFVPVDFEQASWWAALVQAGFDLSRPAVVTCTGVTLYLSKEAIADTLRRLSSLAAGSTVAITFYLPIDALAEEDRMLQEIAEKGAREAGTPFVSFFNTNELGTLADASGFKGLRIIGNEELGQYYFNGRNDSLYPASGELFLLAST